MVNLNNNQFLSMEQIKEKAKSVFAEKVLRAQVKNIHIFQLIKQLKICNC